MSDQKNIETEGKSADNVQPPNENENNGPAPAAAGGEGGEDTPYQSIVALNPAHAFFRNQFFMEEIVNLCDLETSQRLYIIRKYHSIFVQIADYIMSQLQMEAMKGSMARAVHAMKGGGGGGGGGVDGSAFLSASPLSPNNKNNNESSYFQYNNLNSTQLGGSFSINNVATNRSELVAREQQQQRRAKSASPINGGVGSRRTRGVGGGENGDEESSPNNFASFDASIANFMLAGGGGNDPNADYDDEILASFASPFGKLLLGSGSNNNRQLPRAASSSPTRTLKSSSFPVSTQPIAEQFYMRHRSPPLSPSLTRARTPTNNNNGSHHRHIDDLDLVIDVDVSAAVKRKDNRVRAFERAFSEERRKAIAFEKAEQKRTEAFRRRQQLLQNEQLTRAGKQNLNSHTTFIQLQKTKEEVAQREQIRNREKAVETRKEIIKLNSKAQQETRRRMEILAHDTVEATRKEFLDASAKVKLGAQKCVLAEDDKRVNRDKQTREIIHRETTREKFIEANMARFNQKAAENLQRSQHVSHGQRDADLVIRPYKVTTGKFGIVRDVPVDAMLKRPHFADPSSGVLLSPRHHHGNASFSSSTSSSTKPPPIDPITYHRLCGGVPVSASQTAAAAPHLSPYPSSSSSAAKFGNDSLSPAAIYEEAYGRGKRMSDLDSYYLLRGPQDVSWKR